MTSASVSDPRDSSDASSIRLGWAAGGKIALYQLSAMDIATLEAWCTAVYEDIMAWPADKPYRALHDLTLNEHLSLSPRARAYGLKLFYARHDLKGRVVALLNKTVPAQIAARVIRTFTRLQSRSSLTVEIFFDRQKAIDWLLAGSPEDQR
jgi:hypothetical protein